MAQVDLGTAYREGYGVTRDYQKALYWYQKAANQGASQAQAGLGDMFLRGQGVPQDDTKARYWLQRAADQGHAQAQHNLGVMYALGQNVPLDNQKAYQWALLSAIHGDRESIGMCEALKPYLTADQLQQAQEWVRNWKPVVSKE